MPRCFDPTQLELMDRPQPVSPELERDLENLVSLNRRFGSHRLLLSFARRWLKPGRHYRVLDLATGAGDLPRVLVSWARARGVELSVDAVDFQPATLEIAAAAGSAFPEITWIKDDILSFSSEQPYDLVTCSLALHHFSEKDAVQILQSEGASDIERAQGKIADGDWVDFDPRTPPVLITAKA